MDRSPRPALAPADDVLERIAATPGRAAMPEGSELQGVILISMWHGPGDDDDDVRLSCQQTGELREPPLFFGALTLIMQSAENEDDLRAHGHG